MGSLSYYGYKQFTYVVARLQSRQVHVRYNTECNKTSVTWETSDKVRIHKMAGEGMRLMLTLYNWPCNF